LFENKLRCSFSNILDTRTTCGRSNEDGDNKDDGDVNDNDEKDINDNKDHNNYDDIDDDIIDDKKYDDTCGGSNEDGSASTSVKHNRNIHFSSHIHTFHKHDF
jgi:hypothetical protein